MSDLTYAGKTFPFSADNGAVFHDTHASDGTTPHYATVAGPTSALSPWQTRPGLLVPATPPCSDEARGRRRREGRPSLRDLPDPGQRTGAENSCRISPMPETRLTSSSPSVR